MKVLLRSVTYKVVFSTGRVLSNSLEFERGLTAVTGPNESGKTVVIEMIRYALFGSAALRGGMSSYQSIDVELGFTVKEKDYVVTRSKSNALLVLDGSPIATGVSPVNTKIVEIFGYELSTFDTANAALQGDVERLSNMRPTDRKRLVDRLIGLDNIDELTKWTGERALEFGREATALEAILREPEAPVQPPAYRPSSLLLNQVEELETKKQRLDRLKGELSVKLVSPVLPETTVLETAEHLKLYADIYLQEKAELRQLMQAPPRFTQYTDEQLKQFGLLNKQAKAWEEYDKFKRYEPTDTHTCPACSHVFSDDPERHDAYYERILELSDIASRFSIEAGSELGERLPAGPLTDAEITAYPKGRDEDRVQTLQAKLEVCNWFDLYQERLIYERELERYGASREEFLIRSTDRDAKLIELEGLESGTAGLGTIREAALLARDYELALGIYQQARNQYDEHRKSIKLLKEKQLGWLSAKKALTYLKTLVKSHLLPSLNLCASTLLSQMTGGQRQSVVVDDSFEVLVDGQDLETLSGSGKSVVNLALRLGLGQVLTHGVFSVFIGDEIDAFMDQDRATNTAETLRNICSSILQVIVITHKSVDADHTVTLGVA